MSSALPALSAKGAAQPMFNSPVELLTPPSSPGGPQNGFQQKPFVFRQNAFAQWATPPPSPTLSAGTDEESEIGMSDAGSSRSPSPPSAPTTPKGHPLENSKSLLWGHHFSNHVRNSSQGSPIGLGLGMEKKNGFDLSEDAFEVREQERRAGKSTRSSISLAEQQPKTWPKLRISRRSRPALYMVGCIFSLILFLVTHQPSTLPAQHLLRSKAQLDFRSNTPSLAFARGGTTSTAIVNRRARSDGVRAQQKVFAQPKEVAAAMKERWIWANREEELAALLGYIISAEANHIPAVDASSPLDPSLLLDFDPYSRSASSHLTELQHNLWNDYPVVLLAKQRNPHTRFIVSELAKLHLNPKPFVIDTDARADTDILVGLMERLVDRADLPLLFVGGKAIGGWAEVDDLVKEDSFKSLILSAGAVSVPIKKKAKKQGHGGKTEEQLAAQLEADKRKDEEKRKRAAEELELERLRLAALEGPVEVPVEDTEDQEFYTE